MFSSYSLVCCYFHPIVALVISISSFPVQLPRVSLIAYGFPNRHLIISFAVILFSIAMLTPIAPPNSLVVSYSILCDLDLVLMTLTFFSVRYTHGSSARTDTQTDAHTPVVHTGRVLFFCIANTIGIASHLLDVTVMCLVGRCRLHALWLPFFASFADARFLYRGSYS